MPDDAFIRFAVVLRIVQGAKGRRARRRRVDRDDGQGAKILLDEVAVHFRDAVRQIERQGVLAEASVRGAQWRVPDRQQGAIAGFMRRLALPPQADHADQPAARRIGLEPTRRQLGLQIGLRLLCLRGAVRQRRIVEVDRTVDVEADRHAQHVRGLQRGGERLEGGESNASTRRPSCFANDVCQTADPTPAIMLFAGLRTKLM